MVIELHRSLCCQSLFVALEWCPVPGPARRVVAMPRFLRMFLACCWASAWASSASAMLSLDGSWTLTNPARGLQVAGTVPGGVYSDLRASGQLPQDLFYRFNDREYRWVGKENWTYERSFQAPRQAVERIHQILVFDGVDTVADVYLNGHHLGSTDNMFVRYRFDVKGILQAGASNLVEVRFKSPVIAANERFAEQAKKYVVPPKCPDPHYHGECSVNHLRKMQASFAWDWGPAFPSMGLWKSVRLEAYDEVLIREVGFTARPSASKAKAWKASVRVHWEAGTSAAPRPVARVAAQLIAPDGAVVARKQVVQTLVPDQEGAGYTDITLSLPPDSVQLWWPNGYGESPLYQLNVTASSLDRDMEGLWGQASVRVGFRTVELVQEEVVSGDPERGLSYYFRVNGVPVFAKGSNWIPSHVLPELGGDPERVGHLLRSAKEANMNMLRVWGGGVYESDLFYQLADELGILVWQDLMFACSMYPVDAAFRRSVDREVRQQFRRLNHHPSVALWAGNNENEAALRGNWYGTDGVSFEQYHRDYVKLYVDTVGKAIREESLTATFVVSSPSNGAESEREDYLARNPYSSLYGDDHHYDYTSNAWNPAVFHHTRFGSEYGFMSWPQRATMLTATDSEHADEDLAIGSEMAEQRQHHPVGNIEMSLQILQHLPLPTAFNESQNFDTFVYFSQIYQAMATKTETEFLRRSRNLLTPNGEGRTMGALYWQLNDIWQAPSWAGIDFAGRWKMLHHMAVDFFSPLIVSPHVDGDVLNVDVVCDDVREDVLQVRTDVLGWDSFAPRAGRVDAVRMRGAGTTPRALSTALQPLLSSAGCGKGSSCLIRVRVTDGNATTVAPDNFLFPRSPKDSPMPTVTFKVSDVSGPLPGIQHQPWDYSFTLSASSPAAFVWLEAGSLTGRFSKNGFHLTDDRPVQLRFHSDVKMNPSRLARLLSVTALNGRYASRRANSLRD